MSALWLAASLLVAPPDAAQELARGRAAIERRTPEGLEQGAAAFELATRLAPDSAEAWAALADASSLLGLYAHRAPIQTLPRAAEAARRALALDPGLPAAHAALGLSLYLYQRDYAAAEAAFQRSIELDPETGQVRHWYAMLLLATGRGELAVAQVDAALAREPDSAVIAVKRGTVLSGAGRREQADAQLRAALERHPQLPLAWRERGAFEMERGELATAAEAFEQARRLEGSPRAEATLGSLQARLGRPEAARQVLEQLHAASAEGWVPPLSFALVHAGLGEADAAFEWIGRAFEAHDPGLVYLGVSPGWEPLRADPRFAAALARAGLPAH